MIGDGAIGGVKRGCGLRKGGGAYMECGTSPFGRPVEYFLLCPPRMVNPKEFGLTARGVQLVEYDGLWHVMDWVGAEHYPHVADFVEEVRRYGASRRLQKDLDFSKLTDGSRMILLHPQAWIDEPRPFHMNRLRGHALNQKWDYCPKDLAHDPEETCAGLWWEDVSRTAHNKGERIGKREMPSFDYWAAIPPKGQEKAKHTLAMFAMFPITRLAIIRAKDGSHEEAYDHASKSSLPCEVVEE